MKQKLLSDFKPATIGDVGKAESAMDQISESLLTSVISGVLKKSNESDVRNLAPLADESARGAILRSGILLDFRLPAVWWQKRASVHKE